MYPILIKCAVVFGILIAHFLLTTKIKTINESKIKKRIICSITGIITFLLVLTPFENLFLQADTPEKVFEYTTIGTIVAKEEGADSCALLYKTKTSSFSTMLLIKNGEKYKKHDSFSEVKSFLAESDSYNLHVYIRQADGSSDCYMLIGGEIAEEIEITDSTGTEFQSVYSKTDENNKKHVYYLEKIIYTPENYDLYINGSSVFPK